MKANALGRETQQRGNHSQSGTIRSASFPIDVSFRFNHREEYDLMDKVFAPSF